MPQRHVVALAADAHYRPPADPRGGTGLTRWSIVDENSPGAVHTEFNVFVLEPGGLVPTAAQSYEESFYVLEGQPILQTADGATRLIPGDYGLLPIGTPHSWRNDASSPPARVAQMRANQPRAIHGYDVFWVPELAATEPALVDVRDPRCRSFGHIEPHNMDKEKQRQEFLALSASMRTALLVYSGITLKMMVDSDLGSQLQDMFMVQYEPGGTAGPHDHPFEETYLFVDGECEATFDGQVYTLRAGDAAFAGVGCVHSFRNLSSTATVRWLETQSPRPPGRHAYRFVRDWDYLTSVTEKTY